MFIGRLESSRFVVVIALILGLPIAVLFFLLIKPVAKRMDISATGSRSSTQWFWVILVVSVAICVRLGLGYARPVFMAGDSIGYIQQAQEFIKTGSFEHFNVLRPIGYPLVVMAAFEFFEDASVGLLVIQGVISLLTALAAYAAAIQVSSFRVSLAVLNVVSLDPMLLVYEHYVLTESLAAFWVATMAFFFVTLLHAAALRKHWSLLGMSVLCGLFFGASVYVRGNLRITALVLIVVASLAFLSQIKWYRALVAIGLLVGITTGVSYPQLDPDESMSVLHWNRVLFMAVGGFSDRASMNQAGSFSYSNWEDIDANADQLQREPHKVVWALDEEARSYDRFATTTEAYEAYAYETVFRKGPTFFGFWSMWMVNLLGGPPPPDQDENEFWSLGLRGLDTYSSDNWSGPRPSNELSAQTLSRVTRPIAEPTGLAALIQQSFDLVYGGFKPLRWMVLVLFLLGFVIALRHLAWPLMGLCLMALANAGFLATIMLSGNTRFGVPFYPVVWLVAFITMGLITRQIRDQFWVRQKIEVDH